VGDILFPLAVHVFERSQNPNHIMFVNDARGSQQVLALCQLAVAI